MFSRCHALCVDVDATALSSEPSQPKPVHRAVRALDISGR
jgi:hypothetical protein